MILYQIRSYFTVIFGVVNIYTMSRKVFFKLIVPNYNNIAYIKMCLDSIV